MRSPERAHRVNTFTICTIVAGLVGALALAPRPITAQVAAAAPRDTLAATGWARITYVSGTSYYLEVGSKDGLREGTHLEVIRTGAVIAELVVAYISTTRAACTVVRSTVDPALGDSVRYTPVAAPAAVVGPGGSTTGTRAGGNRPPSLRGRIGVRYLVTDPGTGQGGGLTQPAFDLRLDGAQMGGSPIGLAIDVRAQRSMTAVAPGSDPLPPASVTRVYQAALLVNGTRSPFHLTAGRQFAGALSTVGLFDGVAIDMVHSHVSYGVLGGYQPDLATFDFSNLIRQYGAYLQFHNAPTKSPMWSLTAGGVGAYQGTEINREFGYLRLTFNSRWFSLYAAQEVDVNRGWRAEAEGSSTTPTSTFATAQVMLSDAISVYGGVDNRRNVRLYRDYLSPESTFDDAFREGVWGGSSLSLFGHLRLSADVREGSGGSSGHTQSVTASASLWRLTPLQLGLHARSTRYTGDLTSGDLQSLALELNPWSALRVQVTSGVRSSMTPLASATPDRTTWTGVDADIGFGRSVYLWLSMSREAGALSHFSQSYAALSYRF